MLVHLDIPTLLLMTAVLSATMALGLWVMRPKRREGVGLWALGLMLQAAAFLLLALRGQAPDWASVVLAYVLLSCTLALALGAVRQFQGLPMPWPWLALPVLASCALYPLYVDDLRARILWTSVVLPLQLLLTLWALWRPQSPVRPRGALLLSAGLALQAFLLALGGLLVAFETRASAPPMSGHQALQWPVFLSAFVVIILTAVGFILMTKDRADAFNLHIAAHDPLTGVANRRSLIMALDRDVARSRRLREAYALLMLDIDHFKHVNDTYGHQAGDEVLRHMAAVVLERLRAQDTVGRYGGEEFLVLLPHTDLDGARDLAEQLRRAVARTPCHWEGQKITVTVSIGIWGGLIGREDSWDMLVDAADRAMYLAKQNGRNRVEIVTSLRELASPPAPLDNPATFPAALR